MTAKDGDTVQVHYVGRLPEGDEFDSSRDRDPLEFTLGAGQVIPGFEEIVEGMEVGEKVTETIPADEAYGPRRDDLVREVAQEQFPEEFEPAVGERIQIQAPQGGRPIDAIVAEVAEETVTLDMNHPLAGEDLEFEIELVSINGK